MSDYRDENCLDIMWDTAQKDIPQLLMRLLEIRQPIR